MKMKCILWWISAIIISDNTNSSVLACDINSTRGCNRGSKTIPFPEGQASLIFNLCSDSYSFWYRGCGIGLCECKDGYKLDIQDNRCVLTEDCSTECPIDQIWSPCALRRKYLPTCDLYSDWFVDEEFNGTANGCFQVGCVCKLDDYLINRNGSCVPINKCDLGCVEPNTTAECSTSKLCKKDTWNTCNTDFHIFLPDYCRFKKDRCTFPDVSCICNDGYVYNFYSQKCIKPEDCPNCPSEKNLTAGCRIDGRTRFDDNWIILNNSCSDYNKNIIYWNKTESELMFAHLNKIYLHLCDIHLCECKYGYVYNRFNDLCVLPKDCPNCPGYRNLTEGCKKVCKNGKNNLCSNYKQNNTCEDDQPCDFNFCECKDHYVFDNKTDQCVKPEDCSYSTATTSTMTTAVATTKATTAMMIWTTIASTARFKPPSHTAPSNTTPSGNMIPKTKPAKTKIPLNVKADNCTEDCSYSTTATSTMTSAVATTKATTTMTIWTTISSTTRFKPPSHTAPSHTTPSRNMTPKTKPAKPKGPLKVVDMKADNCKVKWEPPDDDDSNPIDSYVVEMMDIESGDWMPVCTTNTTEANVTGLNKGKDYLFRVKAVNCKGDSEMLVTYNVTKVKNPYVGPNIQPAKPKGPLIVSDVSTDSCKLKWGPPEDDGGKPVDSYVVEMMDIELGRWVPVCTTKTPEADIEGLSEGKDYLFRVKAVSLEGESEKLVTDIVTKAKNPYGTSGLSSDYIKREGKRNKYWEYKVIIVIGFLVCGAVVVKVVVYLQLLRRRGTDEQQRNLTEQIQSREGREPPTPLGDVLPLVENGNRCKECQIARKNTDKRVWVREIQEHGHSHIVNHLMYRSFSDSDLMKSVSTNECVDRPTTLIEIDLESNVRNMAKGLLKVSSQIELSSTDVMIDEDNNRYV